MPNMFWQIHNAGLINQVMSVELGCCISFLEKQQIHFFDYAKKSYGNIFVPSVKTMTTPEMRSSRKPNVFDLLDIPSEIDFRLIDAVPHSNYIKHENIIQSYYKYGNNSHNEQSFSEGRSRLHIDKHADNHFQTNCFSFYSRFIFNRPRELDLVLNKLRFKRQYVEFAKKISSQLSNFSAMHIRLTDHAKNYHSTSENRYKHFNRAKERHNKIIFSTDDVDLIRSELKNDCIFVDEIILNHFKEEFLSLEFHDEVVLGLISLLVLSDSGYFIGTPGSTFSSYIHRLRLLNNKSECFLFMDSSHNEHFTQNGPYSWNGFNCHVAAKNWWREWPECRLDI